MNYIKIIEYASYLPDRKVVNNEIEEKLELEEGYIYKRTGIKERYYAEETIAEMAIKVAKKIEKIENIGLIIVATTSSNNLMPGISNIVQKNLKIEKCICMDILAGCSGFINAVDIAKLYIETGRIEKALVIGIDLLSKVINNKDIATVAVLSDGAGAIVLEKTSERKEYYSNIVAEVDKNDILFYKNKESLYMNGKEVYKYAVTKTVENIKELLEKSGEKLENIKYIIPHQSNLKIMKAIASRLKIEQNKMYINIQNKGNTFCASIPIVLEEMKTKGLLSEGDKIILIGYGGGLNTGSILLEI